LYYVTKAPNQITGANSRRAIQFDGYRSHNTVVAGASALPAAVAQFHRSVKEFIFYPENFRRFSFLRDFAASREPDLGRARRREGKGCGRRAGSECRGIERIFCGD
jgi:hypothetical protein